MAFGIIYRLHCVPSGRDYIGQTRGSLERRWRSHKHAAKAQQKRGCVVLNRALLKHGAAAFHKTVIATAASQKELDSLEARYIRKFRTIAPLGYNLRLGGEHASFTAASIHKLRRAARKRANSPEWKAKLRATCARRAGLSLKDFTRKQLIRQGLLPRPPRVFVWQQNPRAASAANAARKPWSRKVRASVSAKLHLRKVSKVSRQRMSNALVENLTGRRFGRWTVLNRASTRATEKRCRKNPRGTQRPHWTCQCKCGTIRSVCGSNLRAGLTRSCGNC